ETWRHRGSGRVTRVAPSQGRGLKLPRCVTSRSSRLVAPSQGRGLKLVHLRHHLRMTGRPLTGAWIETTAAVRPTETAGVAPSQGRGLKHVRDRAEGLAEAVAPSQGRGLKLVLP